MIFRYYLWFFDGATKLEMNSNWIPNFCFRPAYLCVSGHFKRLATEHNGSMLPSEVKQISASGFMVSSLIWNLDFSPAIWCSQYWASFFLIAWISAKIQPLTHIQLGAWWTIIKHHDEPYSYIFPLNTTKKGLYIQHRNYNSYSNTYYWLMSITRAIGIGYIHF